MAESAVARAEELRQAGRHAEALELFRTIWNEQEHPDVGCGLANCLRHLGRSGEALEILRPVLKAHPAHAWARREWIWAVYKHRLAPALKQERTKDVLAAAGEIVDAGADGLALRLACLGAAKVARAKRDWPTVLEWTSRLQPASLDPKPRTYQGKTLPSERERWYLLHIRALLETGRHEEAIASADEALAVFQGHQHFRRWKALALSRAGREAEALEQLEDLCASSPDWYNHAAAADVAERSGQLDKAVACAARALRDRAPMSLKVNVIETFARVSQALGRGDEALLAARLAVAIREENGWPVREPLLRLAGACRSEDADSRQLAARAETLWERRCQDDRPRSRGTVVDWRDGRSFAFIRDSDGKQVFVLVRDLPEAARHSGAEVSFALEPSFDRKKQRRSVRAVAVRLHEGQSSSPSAGAERATAVRKAALERHMPPTSRDADPGSAPGTRPNGSTSGPRQKRLDL